MRLKLLIAGILCLLSVSCSKDGDPEEPTGVSVEYPFYIYGSGTSSNVRIPYKGADPVVCIPISRGDDKYDSFRWIINGEETTPEGSKVEEYNTIDIYSAKIPNRGNIKVEVSATYKSGKVYNNKIEFTYNGEY